MRIAAPPCTWRPIVLLRRLLPPLLMFSRPPRGNACRCCDRQTSLRCARCRQCVSQNHAVIFKSSLSIADALAVMASRVPVLVAGILMALIGVDGANFSCLPSNNPVFCSALGEFYFFTNGSGWTKAGTWNAAAAGVYVSVLSIFTTHEPRQASPPITVHSAESIAQMA